MFDKLKYFIIFIFILFTIFACFFIPKTKINYDPLYYLPDNSKTKEAYEVMKNEFGDNGTLYVFINYVNNDDILIIRNKLFIDGVKNIDYRINDNKVLYNLILSEGDYSKEATNIIKNVINILDNGSYQYYLNGQSYLTYLYNKTINEQIYKIILWLLPVILLILFLTSKSYLDPILFITVIGISIILNMGTNALLSNVSYMTHSIAATIQLAVCMDYSIMLLHIYQNVKEKEKDCKIAIQIAWKTSFIPIVSSALTTVAGFVAIMFMRYKIGLDIGLVLAKGVLLSLITILLLLPCLILIFDKLLTKTLHKSWIIKEKKQKLNFKKLRFITPIVSLLIIITAFFIQNNNKFLYSENTMTNLMPQITESNHAIKTYFGHNSQAVLLIDEDVDATNLITKLENVKFDNLSYLKFVYGLDKQLTEEMLLELVKDYQVSRSEINFLMQILQKNSISLRELTSLLINLKKPMRGEEMHHFVNSFITLDIANLAFIYQIINTDLLTIEELITFITKDFDKESLQGFFREEDLTVMFNQLGKNQIKLIEAIDYFYLNFNTAYDIDTLMMVLKNSVSRNYIEDVLNFKKIDKISVKDFTSILLLDYPKEDLTIFLQEIDDALIGNIYQAMNDRNLLRDSKTSINDFSLFTLANYEQMISAEYKTMLEGLVSKMTMLERINAEIKLISSNKEMLDKFNQVNLTRITNSLNIDVSLITKEFVANKYQRLILNVNLPEESEISFTYFAKLEEVIKNNIDDYYFISRSTSVMEIKETSQYDYFLASMISIVIIFIIILISFRSVTIPVILVLLIQGAVYINMAIPALLGEELMFIGYVIVSCIQLGATIDYAILMTHRYTTNRKQHDKNESMYLAVNQSKSSILTSGSILTIAGLSLTFLSSIPVIRSMGRLIGIGGFISMLMVILILPQILYLNDKIIIKINE